MTGVPNKFVRAVCRIDLPRLNSTYGKNKAKAQRCSFPGKDTASSDSRVCRIWLRWRPDRRHSDARGSIEKPCLSLLRRQRRPISFGYGTNVCSNARTSFGPANSGNVSSSRYVAIGASHVRAFLGISGSDFPVKQRKPPQGISYSRIGQNNKTVLSVDASDRRAVGKRCPRRRFSAKCRSNATVHYYFRPWVFLPVKSAHTGSNISDRSYGSGANKSPGEAYYGCCVRVFTNSKLGSSLHSGQRVPC